MTPTLPNLPLPAPLNYCLYPSREDNLQTPYAVSPKCGLTCTGPLLGPAFQRCPVCLFTVRCSSLNTQSDRHRPLPSSALLRGPVQVSASSSDVSSPLRARAIWRLAGVALLNKTHTLPLLATLPPPLHPLPPLLPPPPHCILLQKETRAPTIRDDAAIGVAQLVRGHTQLEFPQSFPETGGPRSPPAHPSAHG